ncbi:hypothetical protein GCM10023115_09280 [Pontixanthobacter gangjinensis]|uniref:Secreted protein n=1 Tax=Pontixanthobacter gangjinensis TaxID=1028742 RepID=A0A6I4SKJ3_9SPHN|nr:hypothetical protein [Pontixanthobacter gangjinensis]MXO56174.1 hypothetical protein [Pontixanthobacter gangjinensis]
MFSGKSIMPIKSAMKSGALACAAIAMAASAAANAGVVIKSSGPSASQYPVGKKIDDSGRITLKAGDSVTIMANGGTREIRGAGTHRVAERGVSKRSTFAALTKQRSNSRVRTGAARTGTGPLSSVRSNLWYVDVTESGPVCVADFSAVRMWRPERELEATYVVANSNSAEHLHVTFAEKTMIADWDAARMPLSENSPYTISGPGNVEPVTITFAALDAVPDNPEDLATALIEKGCTSQLELLATKMM